MTTGINLSASSADWQMWQKEQMQAAKAKMNQSGYVSKTNNTDTQKTTVKKISSENICTDGNDDGKIGFFAAAGHAIKGAAKGLWNGIKGCFTNSEGKFSIGKTLLTVGVAAACIAFPAVGLVACGIGAVSGAVTLGKGIYNAATAETDAQAKDAWENIGDGALTLATSVVGAKASLKAVKATSTAGIASVDDAAKAAQKAGATAEQVEKIKSLENVDDAIKAAKEVGAKTSKLGNLAEDATKFDKLKALGSDMASSTKNNGAKVLAQGSEIKEALDVKKAEHKASKIDQNTALTDEELHILKEAEVKRTFAQDNSTLQKMDKATDAISNSKANLKASLTNKVQQQKAAFGETVKNTTSAAKETIKHPIQTTKARVQNIKDGVKNIQDLKPKSLANVKAKLSGNGAKILDALKEGSKSYTELAQEYGYSNVLQVIEVAQGYAFAKESV